MEGSSDSESSESDFGGFQQKDVDVTEKNLDIVPDSQESISDIDIDFDYSSSDSDSGNGPNYDENNSEPVVNSDEHAISDEEDIPGNVSPMSDTDLFELFDKPISWTQNFRDINLHEFNSFSGPKLPPDFDVATAKPKDYFSLFVTEEMLETITRNTNGYQEFVLNRKCITEPDYVDKLWTKNVDLPEMKAYLGLAILMGLTQVPRFKCYWSTCIFLGNQGFKNTIPLRRYEKITEYLHVTDRKAEPAPIGRYYDRIHKVRWFLDSLNSSFAKYHAPTRDQTIDEGKYSVVSLPKMTYLYLSS